MATGEQADEQLLDDGFLSDDGLCDGCHRTNAEIARWSQMNDDERLHLMETVLPERESRRG